jgi:hypothetical protein
MLEHTPIGEAQERRATARFVRYWASLRRSGGVPSLAQFDPRWSPVPWEDCFLAVLGPSGDATFRHIGARLRFAHRPATSADFVHAILDRTSRPLGASDPVEGDGEYGLGDGTSLLYRFAAMPFIDGGGRVEAILGAVTSCRVPAPHQRAPADLHVTI